MNNTEFKNMDNMESVTKIQRQINDIFDLFRGELSGAHDYDLLLLLLSLYKDNQISKDFLLRYDSHKTPQMVSDYVSIYQKAQRDYQPLIEAFSSSLVQMSKAGFHKVINLLFEIDKMTLKENFRDIFENTLYQIVSSQGRMSMPIQPIELTRFIYT